MKTRLSILLVTILINEIKLNLLCLSFIIISYILLFNFVNNVFSCFCFCNNMMMSLTRRVLRLFTWLQHWKIMKTSNWHDSGYYYIVKTCESIYFSYYFMFIVMCFNEYKNDKWSDRVHLILAFSSNFYKYIIANNVYQ